MSFWLNIFIHTAYIEYVIKEYVFMSLWLNIIYTFMSFCLVFYIFNLYEKATSYQWFEEQLLSLQHNQLS